VRDLGASFPRTSGAPGRHGLSRPGQNGRGAARQAAAAICPNVSVLRILFATPGYWPSTAYGGPIAKMRDLAGGLVGRGHTVEVVTTTLTAPDRRPDRTGRIESVDGVAVHYLGTPLRYRWMGITPSLRRTLAGLDRPDIVHVFGFRDFVGTVTARWAQRERIPFVFEGLGMVRPRLHKVALKRALDATIFRPVLAQAALLVAASSLESSEYLDAGIEPGRVAIRPNGFPAPVEAAKRPGPLRSLLGLDIETPLVLSVGRVAHGKGIELLVRALPAVPGAHLAVVGPDDRGLTTELKALADGLGLAGRVHFTGAWPSSPVPPALYSDADVCGLASAGESFGMAAAEAAAAGTALLVTDRCGIAELLRDGAGLVVSYDQTEISTALARLVADDDLRRRLGAGARGVAAAWAWPKVAGLQEDLYRRALGNG